MARCGNCGAKFGCSCKKRTASDGKICCVNCITNYERVLKQSGKPQSSVQAIQPTATDTAPSAIISVTAVQKE